MGLGIAILALSRPYEGVLLCFPVGFVLARWIFSGNNRPSFAFVLAPRRAATRAHCLRHRLARLLRLPRLRQPAHAALQRRSRRIRRGALLDVASPAPRPVYHHKAIHDFYIVEELGYANRLHTLPGFFSETFFFKPLRTLLFYAGIALLPPLFLLRRAVLDRRIRFVVVCIALVVSGVIVETWLIPHYFAAIMPAIYALGLQMMRHLRQWKPGGQPVGAAMQRFTIGLIIGLAVLRAAAEPLHFSLAEWPSGAWASTWTGPGQLGLPRKQIEDKLNALPGKQLVIVHYSPNHSSLDEWVYNAPDIDNSKIIWAREMDPAQNSELLNYYKDRTVWLAQPDEHPVALSPYPTQ